MVAKSVWSHTTYAYKGQGEAIDGLAVGAGFNISVQGESDGMATFAHEFGHIRDIADNYNKPELYRRMGTDEPRILRRTGRNAYALADSVPERFLCSGAAYNAVETETGLLHRRPVHTGR